MADHDVLLERARGFLLEVPTNPVGAVIGIPPGIAAHVYGKKKVNRLAKKRGKARRTAVRNYVYDSPTMSKALLPKNEKSRRKLAKRDASGHIVHGAARYFGSPLGFTNTVRYAHKVRAAKKGLHREM